MVCGLAGLCRIVCMPLWVGLVVLCPWVLRRMTGSTNAVGAGVADRAWAMCMRAVVGCAVCSSTHL